MGTYSIFLILIVLVAFLLVLVIMVQNPKGGGLSSSFGGGGTQQLGGVKQTTDFLDKSTWTLGGLLLGLILLSNIAFNQSEITNDSKALDTNEVFEEELPLPNQDNILDVDKVAHVFVLLVLVGNAADKGRVARVEQISLVHAIVERLVAIVRAHLLEALVL